MTTAKHHEITFAKVKSKMLSKVGYDEANKTLHVQFPNGSTYHYFDVAPSLHSDMMAAPSIGSFFGKHVRGKHKMLEAK